PPPPGPGPAGRPTNSAVVLGPLVPEEARRRGELIDVGLGGSAIIDEPVASGGDSSLWVDNDKDEDEEERPPR
ncbi:MAG TPA: hypothetical protein VFP12_16220, partial [Allosphingosinicella sp.]|nr:hypothetical protein [Allosphingosinicella sp.]